MKSIGSFYHLGLIDKLSFFPFEQGFNQKESVETAFYALKIGHPFWGVFYKTQGALYFAEDKKNLQLIFSALAPDSGYYIDLSKPFLNQFQKGEIVKAGKNEIKNCFFPLHGLVKTTFFLDAARKIEEHFPTQSECYIERAEKWLNCLRDGRIYGDIYSNMSVFDFKREVSPLYPTHRFTLEELLP